MKKTLMSAVLGVGTLAFLISPAAAVKYKTNSVYKATESGITTVYIDGTAGTKVAVDLGQVSKTSSKTATACGSVKISIPKGNESFTGLMVDGVAIDYAALPIKTVPACVNGTFAESRTTNFKTASGQVVIIGKSASTPVSVVLPSNLSKSLSINSCGTGSLKASTGTTLPATFTINGTSYTLANLPDAGHGPTCKKAADGTYSAYIPSSW